MITVIIAGGSGSRLWPLSTNQYPKHLLNLVDDESLLQATYRRAKRLSKSIYVVTAADHSDDLRKQLPELGDDAFIVEPDRRDTAGCFVEALHHIQSRHNHDEPIAFMHADHYIRDVAGFINSFKIAQQVAKKHRRITLVGIEPTHPATGFGYIQKDTAVDEESQAYQVLMFKEKPEFKVAQQYVRSGQYLWNAGYFVGSVNTFLSTMEEYAPDLKQNYDRLVATSDRESYDTVFLSFEKIAIDYALMEKTKNLLVVPATFDWMDLGSFNDVHQALPTDEQANFVRGENVVLDEVENALVRNDEPSKAIAIIGLDNIVVVNTPNGLLVARKDLSQRVKEAVAKLKAQ